MKIQLATCKWTKREEEAAPPGWLDIKVGIPQWAGAASFVMKSWGPLWFSEYFRRLGRDDFSSFFFFFQADDAHHQSSTLYFTTSGGERINVKYWCEKKLGTRPGKVSIPLFMAGVFRIAATNRPRPGLSSGKFQSSLFESSSLDWIEYKFPLRLSQHPTRCWLI